MRSPLAAAKQLLVTCVLDRINRKDPRREVARDKMEGQATGLGWDR